MNQVQDDTTKRIALDMIRAGILKQAEAAELAGVSRQLMRLWAKDIDCKKARKFWITGQWNERLRDAPCTA
jgi:DNA-binding XRE family transcriptional regulator